jgi:hypothetical protein
MRAANWNAWKRSRLAMLAAGAFVFGGVSGAAAQERINWTDLVNAEIRGNSVEKTGGCDGCGDAGATSTQVIESNGGYVEFRVPEDWTYLVAGLANRTRGTRFDDIEFGIRLNGNGSADIVERGRYVGGDTDYQAGDTFRIEVTNGRIRYLRNGNLMATSRSRPTFPLAFDVGFGSLGASVANAHIGAGRVDDNDDLALGGGNRDDFETLDRNNDGVITLREWTGSRRAFNDRDTNGDGQITYRELSDGSDRRDGPLNNVVGTAGDIIPVSATERWTDTGLTVRAGDSIAIEADGTIQMSGDRGDTAEPAGGRRNAPGALVRNAPAGMLIGRIGNGAPFAVGARRTIARAPASGRLYLGVNDDYLGDNDGQFNAMVSVEPRTR